MTALHIALLIFFAVFAFAAFKMAQEKTRYRREVAEIYRQRYNPVHLDTDELSNRVTEYQREENPRDPTRSTRTVRHSFGKRNTKIVTMDRRIEYMEKRGLYTEQCNNFIHLLKADLEPNGMS